MLSYNGDYIILIFLIVTDSQGRSVYFFLFCDIDPNFGGTPQGSGPLLLQFFYLI